MREMKRLVLVLLCPATALGDAYLTGSNLQRFCANTAFGEPKDAAAMYNVCTAYLTGMSDAAKAFSQWGHEDRDVTIAGSCIPPDVSAEQLRQVWRSCAGKYPEKLHLAAASLAINAFEVTWPCKR